MPMRPLSNQSILIFARACNHIWDNRPCRRAVEPSVCPSVIATPINCFTRLPCGESAVIQHHRLTNLMATSNISWCCMADAKVSSMKLKQCANRRDWRPVIMDHFSHSNVLRAMLMRSDKICATSSMLSIVLVDHSVS